MIGLSVTIIFKLGVRVMVFSTTFNNISVISRQSVLMVEETGENHRPVSSYWQAL
jgi:SpoU rRNA methylase family enzyme